MAEVLRFNYITDTSGLVVLRARAPDGTHFSIYLKESAWSALAAEVEEWLSHRRTVREDAAWNRYMCEPC